MPTYQYEPADASRSCGRCAPQFDLVRRLSDPPLTHCPNCGAAVRKIVGAPSVGRSRSSLDDRAKSAGFTKLKRLGKGEYEKQY